MKNEADIVDRLKATAAQGMDIAGIHCAIELEAADYIEQLRLEVIEAYDLAHCDWEN